MRHLESFHRKSYEEKLEMLKNRIDKKLLNTIEDIGLQYEDDEFEKMLNIWIKPKNRKLSEMYATNDCFVIYRSSEGGWMDIGMYLIDWALKYDIVYEYLYDKEEASEVETVNVNQDILNKLKKSFQLDSWFSRHRCTVLLKVKSD